jgi:RimJ/RimL family protein N-acetyltransferase
MVSHPPRPRHAPADQPALETPRLVLRPFVPGDAAALTEAIGDERVARQTRSVPYPYPSGAAEAFIETCAAEWGEGKAVTWAITWRGDGTVVGAVAVRMARRHRRGEVGYWLAVPMWGQGVMTEALATVVAYGFDALGLHRLEARIFPENAASARVLTKCGFVREGTLRGALWKENAPRDVLLYARLMTDAR